MENEQLWQYRLALHFLPNVGNQTAKNLLAYFGQVDQIFKQPAHKLSQIPGIGKLTAASIPSHFNSALKLAEEELRFMQKNNVTPFFYTDSDYPKRLLECPDCPILLFKKGNFDLKRQGKYLAVVGTRNSTEYGRDMTDKIIQNLAEQHSDLVIVSGLAYGIDITAHRKALELNIPTIAVMGTGMNKIYPSEHKNTAAAILEHGALLTEFPSFVPGDKQNFVMRNRIVAGLSDAVLVSESAEKGGSLITADLALSYSRDVLAIPGRIGDKTSAGCNLLIKKNKAALVESATDISYQMNWQTQQKNERKPQIISLFPMTPVERSVYDCIQAEEKINLDLLALRTHIDVSALLPQLIEMEFKGYIKSLPGNQYKTL